MVNQPNTVDQSDRVVPVNLRQSGRTPVELLISTRVRKSPYWHLSHEAGCWRATVYNRIYHPRGYVRPEEGGAAAEHEALTKHVTMWNVAVERQIRVRGPDAERFTDYVITRDATRIEPDAREVRHPLQRAGRHPQRPGAAAPVRGRVLVLAGRLRPAVLAAGRQRRDGDGCRDRRNRRVSAADPGPEVAGADGRPRRRRDPRDSLLRDPGSGDRGLPSDRLAIPAFRARRATRSTCATRPCTPRSCGTPCSKRARRISSW